MARMLLLTMLVAALTGCSAEQSTLAVFGADARAIRHIAIILTSGAILIVAITVALYVRAVRASEHSLSHEQGMRMILWVGAIGPTLILTGLLLYALPAIRPRPADPGDLVIRVEGEQFWWRVAYRPSDNAPPLSSANEIRVPVGRTVVLELMAKVVIHSFRIPGLAGKMDMIAGRTNRLVVKAEKPGRYRGVMRRSIPASACIRRAGAVKGFQHHKPISHPLDADAVDPARSPFLRT
ncbi:Heme/copper-type cytochrome/quinol oxidase, subunit 2 [Sphingobium sp. YR768]|nr:Heme/copper-type cytochrome/quinol oxidase, subunit 2 [Sphingobium sp. YR768]